MRNTLNVALAAGALVAAIGACGAAGALLVPLAADRKTPARAGDTRHARVGSNVEARCQSSAKSP
jgi:predicted small lipoprotein YifL